MVISVWDGLVGEEVIITVIILLYVLDLNETLNSLRPVSLSPPSFVNRYVQIQQG